MTALRDHTNDTNDTIHIVAKWILLYSYMVMREKERRREGYSDVNNTVSLTVFGVVIKIEWQIKVNKERKLHLWLYKISNSLSQIAHLAKSPV